MHQILCPECRHPQKLGANAHKGQRIVCPNCKSGLVLVSADPPELELATLVNHAQHSQKKAAMLEAPCPECDYLIKLSARAHEGQQIICSFCNTTLEVVDTNPLELDYAILANVKWGRQGKVNRQKYFERKNDRPGKKRR